LASRSGYGQIELHWVVKKEESRKRLFKCSSDALKRQLNRMFYPERSWKFGAMEISLLKVLLSSISQFFHLSSSENITDILVQRYYCKAEDLLKILKPILEAIVDVEAASSEMLQKAFAGLAQSVDELRELCETWQPLGSNVLQVEPLIVKTRTCSLEFLELLKTSHECLPADTTLTSLEEPKQVIPDLLFPYICPIPTPAIMFLSALSVSWSCHPYLWGFLDVLYLDCSTVYLKLSMWIMN
uniref:PUB2-4-like N-terminal domain-containing protein n=1 Tax=Solanum lycopersicum TaxID=4081 RepID=A0A3Q7JF49_SOLLC